jgi:hypothetical protein
LNVLASFRRYYDDSFFSDAFLFLAGESEESYPWAIEGFNEVISIEAAIPSFQMIIDNCGAMKNFFERYISGYLAHFIGNPAPHQSGVQNLM